MACISYAQLRAASTCKKNQCSLLSLIHQQADATCCDCCSTTLQGEQVLKDGIGRAPEVEEAVDPVAARQYLQEPAALLQHPSEIIQNLAK